ncbi:MAG: hypothetical protein AAFX99_12045 [Myxococcota bacterium]
MAWSSVDIELGDALRSWCSTGRESDAGVQFDVDLFEQAISGYLDQGRHWLTQAEVEALVPAAERICLELGARFATDTLQESYFRWDPSVAPTPGEHNLLRTRNQLQLAQDIARQRDAMNARLHRLYP